MSNLKDFRFISLRAITEELFSTSVNWPSAKHENEREKKTISMRKYNSE